ncbi:MAG: hypothetical protein ACFCVK_14985 [Acidimicrobiales bacterium]
MTPTSGAGRNAGTAIRPEPPEITDDAELQRERAHLQHIRRVHARHLDRARATAELLAAEAADATEDGIRDLHDPDAESDAAVAASLVRQTADRAMHAYRRVNELEAMGRALAFGSTVDDDGNRLDVGRLSVIDGENALLVDWRADAAIPFYRATPLDRLGLDRRRHLLYGDGVTTSAAELDGYSDEVFTLESLERADVACHLRGEAALLASVAAPTGDRMRSVVATIQAEQDAVIRAPAGRPLLVQGAPGTGKTVVALHRAAYLLYDQRANLSESGVLVIGPTNEFLGYIRGVLPSLGETGVVSVTMAKLFPGILLGLHDDEATAEVKGRATMADLLARAVADRRRRPTADLVAWYGSRRVVLRAAALNEIFVRAGRHQTHNEGATAFAEDVIAALSAEVYNPSFGRLDDATDSFRTSPDVRMFLLRHWPPLSPEQALNDLLGSPALLRSAAADSDLDTREVALLHRPRTSEADLPTIRWSEADVPLLDELLFLLGGSWLELDSDRDVERDEADEFELADRRPDDDGDVDVDVDLDLDLDVGGIDPVRSSGELGGATVSLDDLEAVGLEDPLFGNRLLYEIDPEPGWDGGGEAR